MNQNTSRWGAFIEKIVLQKFKYKPNLDRDKIQCTYTSCLIQRKNITTIFLHAKKRPIINV